MANPLGQQAPQKMSVPHAVNATADVRLKQKPQGVTIVEGFPGFGLIGTITTEYLIDQLKAELIGTIKFREIPTMIAIHGGKVINPIGVYYAKSANLVIIHVITSVQAIEWNLATTILGIAKQLKAKEIISIEGVASPQPSASPKCFYYTDNKALGKKYVTAGLEMLKEGIIVGVTGALLLEDGFPISCIFAESSTGLPDSKAAASTIEVLDKYLKLKIDTKPLLAEAAKFEEKIKGLMEQSKNVTDQQMKKRLNYVG
jgi:uncharacterized protein